MKKTLFSVVLVLMSLVSFASFVSCEKDSDSDSGSNSKSSSSSILGVWEDEEGMEYYFDDDGDFELYNPYDDEVEWEGSWRYSGDKVIVDMYDTGHDHEHIQFTITDITSKSMTINYDGEKMKCHKLEN